MMKAQRPTYAQRLCVGTPVRVSARRSPNFGREGVIITPLQEMKAYQTTFWGYWVRVTSDDNKPNKIRVTWYSLTGKTKHEPKTNYAAWCAQMRDAGLLPALVSAKDVKPRFHKKDVSHG